jgi:hypothetical protein
MYEPVNDTERVTFDLQQAIVRIARWYRFSPTQMLRVLAILAVTAPVLARISAAQSTS